MALVPKTEVKIDGETFDLVTLPNPKSLMVQQAKQNLLGSLDLASLVDDLGKLGNFIRVAYNGGAGSTEIQIKVQKVGYKITNLADQSAVTVHNFKRATKDVLQELQGTYQYLLDGLEEMALETLSLLTDAESKGHSGGEEESSSERKEEFERQKQKAQELQKSAREAEQKANALFNKAQEREDKALDKQGSLFTKLADGLTSMVGAAKAGLGGDFGKAMEQLEKVGDESGYKQAMKMANEEKMKHLDDMQKQRDMRRDAILQCIEFTERIKSCQDDDALADAAIEALHSSIGALKSLSAIMMNAALFWRQMQSHCESLAKGDMQQTVERVMKYPEEKRLKVWTSTAFKTKAVQYYSKWVALDDVCEVYMLQIKETRQDLYSYLTENPTIEEAKKNVRKLADMFAADLKAAQDKLAEKEKKALQERKSLKDSKLSGNYYLNQGASINQTPTPTPTTELVIERPAFEDEITRDLKHTGAGILSMANSGPNTNGSQFFVTLAPTQWLDGKHTVFGRISNGISVVKRIGLVETDPGDRVKLAVSVCGKLEL
ncbi:Peptidyl-prolyl cis-trans isomerase-like 1 [Stylophora pistillata]|uniref:Peptidyl-prolyl cis-trans isomerase-like 1 n=1 Tax=Stylophora pistillata TaxID=50429 RepID=A0A2B4RZH2_STYPI|nr:Peptidyl-prolyl cis-trans isomerase-like 1 [Stylophora pistillata]